MDELASHDFRVGEWWARRKLNELQRGEEKIVVETRSMEVLACLACHAGLVVTKEEILDRVWGEAHVSDGVIAHAISELRRALGESPKEAKFIQTVHRRGYRLVAPVLFARADDEPRVGALLGKGFRLTERLGQGAMGVVFKAVDETLGRQVALKFLTPELSEDPEARRRFLREARLAAQLDHPSLATLHEVSETPGGRLFIVTGYYGGGTLRRRLKAGRLPLTQALELGTQLAEGLEVAHRAGIIHRDIKPANLLLTEDGLLKLADFGIAKLIGSTRLTRTGASLGTPGYKSPEQSRGEEVDQRADIWSLGVVLFEMLTGKAPFHGENELAVLHAIVHSDPPALSQFGEFPPLLEGILVRALAKDPAERYQEVSEMGQDLLSFRTGSVALEISSKEPSGPNLQTNNRRFRGLLSQWPIRRLAVVLGISLSFYLLAWAPLRIPPDGGIDPEIASFISQGMRDQEEGDGDGALQAAVENFQKALEISDHPRTLAHLSYVLARLETKNSSLGHLEEIRSLADRAIKSAPDLWLAHLAIGRVAYLEEDYEVAADAAKLAIGLFPQDLNWHDPPETFAGYFFAAPNASSVHDWGDLPHTLLGYSLFQLKQEKEGIEAVDRGRFASGHHSARLRSQLASADLRMKNRNYDDAIPILRKIIRHDSKNFDAHHQLGFAHFQVGRFRDAIRNFKKALALGNEELGNEAATANSLGASYFAVARDNRDGGDWGRAKDSFEYALALEPLYATPHLGLGDLFRHRPNPDEELALLYYQKALDLWDDVISSAPSAPRVQAQRALCAAKLARHDEAIDQIEALINKNPEEGELKIYAARIYALGRQDEQLYAIVKEALAESPSSGVFAAHPAFDYYFQNDQLFKDIIGEID